MLMKFEEDVANDPKLTPSKDGSDNVTIINQLIQINGQKSVYLWKSDTKKAHPFPDFDTFSSLGFSFNNVYYISEWKMKQMEQGIAVSTELCKMDSCGVKSHK